MICSLREVFMRVFWTTALLIGLGATSAARAADMQAGKSVAQAKCSQCHDADDWEGEDASSLEALIRDIVAGKVKHKGKLELTSAEMTNIAAYWADASKAKKR
jgi:mono/diheme cytochrome c family protein